MKYLLFSGAEYYPLGGFHDFEGSFNTELAALEYAANIACDWWQIVTFDENMGYIVLKEGKR